MRRFTIIFALLVASVNMLAQQVPNGAFDQWANGQPVSWNSLNGTSLSTGVVTCQQGTCATGAGCVGGYYLNLTSGKNSGGVVVPGITVCGTLNTNNLQATGGFAFTQRPTALTGKWQYMRNGSTPGYISVTLTRWDTLHTKRITVASVKKTLTGAGGMVMSWTNFSIPLAYDTTVTPDTCIIVLSASGNTPAQYDYLYINNLGFDGVAAGVEEYKTNNGIDVFPNPATDEITITGDKSNGVGSQLMIYDVVGTLVKSEELNQHQQKISVADLSNGCYVVTIKSNGFISNQRLVVQR